MGARAPLGVILLAALVIGALWGPLQILLMGGLVHVVGRLTGAAGTLRGTLTAIAWAGVPQAAILAVWVIATVPFGRSLYVSADAVVALRSPLLLLTIGLLSLVTLVLLCWWFVLVFKAIAEAQSVSAWRALGHIVGASATVGVVAMLVIGAVVIARA
jgi:hypothetical protein